MFDAFDPAWFSPGLVPGAAGLSPSAAYNSQVATMQANSFAHQIAPPTPVIPQQMTAIPLGGSGGVGNALFDGPPGSAGLPASWNFTPSYPTITVGPDGTLNMPAPAPSHPPPATWPMPQMTFIYD